MWRQRISKRERGSARPSAPIDWAVEGEETVHVQGGAFRALRIAGALPSPRRTLVYEMW
jgi:hypothetical protein